MDGFPPLLTPGAWKSDEARASALGLELISEPPNGLCLARSYAGLGLTGLGSPWILEFGQGPVAKRIGSADPKDPLPRAFGLHRRSTASEPLRIHDPTAGFLRDAAVLASLGCQVQAWEAHPIVHWLVDDALSRCGSRWTQRVQLHLGDGAPVPDTQPPETHPPHAIYLDPMFPPSRKQAAPGKEGQILRALADTLPPATTSPEHLLAQALKHATERVVVKRHPRSAPLGPAPSFEVKSGRVRFDVYIK